MALRKWKRGLLEWREGKKFYKAPFADQRMEDYRVNLETKRKVNSPKLIKKRPGENTRLVYCDGKLYRNFPLDKLKMWQKLIDAGLPVEPILDVEETPNKEILDLLKPQKGEVIVKSRIVGKVVYFPEDLPTFARMSIARQIVELIVSLWSLGYTHCHPNLGNFTVAFESGYPKVYLIDFDQLALAHKRRDLSKDFKYVTVFLPSLVSETPLLILKRKLLEAMTKYYPK